MGLFNRKNKISKEAKIMEKIKIQQERLNKEKKLREAGLAELHDKNADYEMQMEANLRRKAWLEEKERKADMTNAPTVEQMPQFKHPVTPRPDCFVDELLKDEENQHEEELHYYKVALVGTENAITMVKDFINNLPLTEIKKRDEFIDQL